MLAQQPVTLLIDNLETNLGEQTSGPAVISDDILAELIATWAVPHRPCPSKRVKPTALQVEVRFRHARKRSRSQW
ncbi:MULTISPECIES: hypothetical protein [Micromonospora]|uniref:hypothetical protein n=1 Tax=Micromonospora TaxID=1873 RepID=UPI00082949EF|nr:MULTISPECIES: hypothetical protein [Micromonospora]MCT2282249.1 hypothetical protein [Micromonospora chalcea]SCL43455.1 hypothetical protein GA0070615_6481 [Micromonospora aurantiaca]